MLNVGYISPVRDPGYGLSWEWGSFFIVWLLCYSWALNFDRSEMIYPNIYIKEIKRNCDKLAQHEHKKILNPRPVQCQVFLGLEMYTSRWIWVGENFIKTVCIQGSKIRIWQESVIGVSAVGLIGLTGAYPGGRSESLISAPWSKVKECCPSEGGVHTDPPSCICPCLNFLNSCCVSDVTTLRHSGSHIICLFFTLP